VAPPSDRIRIAVVDDYEVVVRGTAAALTAVSGHFEVVELAPLEPVHAEVDIALYDSFAAPEAHGSVVRSILDNPRVARVVVYSWNLDPHLVERALAEGVNGYLSKRLPGPELADALVRVARGETVVLDTDASDPLPRRWPGEELGLTERESEVLALITQGYENRAIAELLYISPNSLKSRIRGLYAKIGASRRSEAIVWGLAHGFEPAGSPNWSAR
jgi:DNA-binding NarL/FixJ family response regulator